MQFSVIFEAQLADPTPERERATLADCVEQAVAAEAAGFDRVWTVEHQRKRPSRSCTRRTSLSARVPPAPTT